MDIYDHICERCRWYDSEKNICVRPPELIEALKSCAIDDYNREVYIESILQNGHLLSEGDKA